jgi:signal transduction histidine kinase
MPANVDSRRGFGLIGMRERVTALDGEIRFHNLPRSGLCIEVEMPLKMSGA